MSIMDEIVKFKKGSGYLSRLFRTFGPVKRNANQAITRGLLCVIVFPIMLEQRRITPISADHQQG